MPPPDANRVRIIGEELLPELQCPQDPLPEKLKVLLELLKPRTRARSKAASPRKQEATSFAARDFEKAVRAGLRHQFRKAVLGWSGTAHFGSGLSRRTDFLTRRFRSGVRREESFFVCSVQLKGVPIATTCLEPLSDYGPGAFRIVRKPIWPGHL